MVLHEKGLDYTTVEVNPFSSNGSGGLARLHPFSRVPVLRHKDFEIYETAAIARYIDAAFPQPALMPNDPRALARASQVIEIVNHYGYWPMVRQVFSQTVFGPLEGLPPDRAEIEAGLQASLGVLSALETMAIERLVLDGRRVTLADCFLAPMLACFTMCEEGVDQLAAHPALERWWSETSTRSFVARTDPRLVDILDGEL